MPFPTNSNRIAIQDGHRTITYRELQLWQKKSRPFYAHNTLESILYLLQCTNPFPLSHRLPIEQARDLAKNVPLMTSLLTSGSTGKPKIAQLTQENLYYSALGAVEYFGLNESDRFLLSLPYFHVGGLAIIWRSLLSGGTLVIPQTKNLSNEIIREKITRVSLVPQQLTQGDFPTVKTVLLGGQAMPDDLGKYDLPLYVSYGMTEMGSVIAAARWNRELVGEILPYRKVRIDDGEIFVGGKTLFAGYLGEEKPGEWFATKDLGSISEKGLQIFGRKDRLFISGGENIQPEEIEAAILSLPEIKRVRVISRKDKKYGERPIAFLDPFPVPNLKKRLEGLLSRFKIPDAFFPLDSEEKSAQLSRDLH